MTEPTCKELSVAIARIDARLSEFDRRYEERFKAQEKAIEKAEAAQEAKNVTLNELRGVVTDQQGAFARSVVVDLQFNTVRSELESIRGDIREIKGQGAGTHNMWGYIVGGAGALVAFILYLLERKQ